jgi:hypothetical protein
VHFFNQAYCYFKYVSKYGLLEALIVDESVEVPVDGSVEGSADG